MSLFDVIAYPIDDRFLLEDLERIPSIILWKWCSEDLDIDPMLSNPTSIYSFMNGGINMKSNIWYEFTERSLKALQRRIKEHDLQP